MPKYLNSQKHNMSCGPVAIANALRHKNRFISYKSIVDLCKTRRKSKFSFKEGMWVPGLMSTIKLFNIEHTMMVGISFERVKETLKENKSLILIHKTMINNKEEGHAIFIEKRTKHFVSAWNKCESGTTEKLSLNKLEKYWDKAPLIGIVIH